MEEAEKAVKSYLYCYTNAMTNEKRDHWKQQEESIFDEVKFHEKQVRAAVSSVKWEEDKEKIVQKTKEMETLKVEYDVEERELGYEELETTVNDPD